MSRLALTLSCVALLSTLPAAQQREPGALRVGAMAPDFTLEPRGGGAAVRLSSFRGRSPVALVFGSYT
jgi:hypothetical protein